MIRPLDKNENNRIQFQDIFSMRTQARAIDNLRNPNSQIKNQQCKPSLRSSFSKLQNSLPSNQSPLKCAISHPAPLHQDQQVQETASTTRKLSPLIPLPSPLQIIPPSHKNNNKPPSHSNKNHSVRFPDDFLTYLQLSTSTRRPLITLWTASYCATCRQITPLLQELIGDEGVGEAEGGVTYCEVEYDAPDIMRSGLGMEYMISSMPTLLAFDGGEAMTGTKVADAGRMKDREFLREWIRGEARRRGMRGAGSGGGGGILKGEGVFSCLRYSIHEKKKRMF
ncbi:hypothetical protein F5884DRAFT_756444 [Xylogone sp. PMI_703]|nr:hypothetical protein F5884DRAFT_756444 [Xylogone sp. PMI_703]